MLDSQRRQVGIGDQVCLHTSGRQERSRQIAMPLRGLGNPDALGFEPSVDLAPRRPSRVLRSRVGRQRSLVLIVRPA
jgi:hypothetical protein